MTRIRPWALALASAALLAGCSPQPAEAPPVEQKAMIGGSTQALVTAQAHLMGEEPRYGAVTWTRASDEGELIVWRLEPGEPTPPVTAHIRGERIEALIQQGVLTRKSLAALAAAAGAAPGGHGPTADKVLAALEAARRSGAEMAVDLDGATYAAAAAGDRVTARPKP